MPNYYVCSCFIFFTLCMAGELSIRHAVRADWFGNNVLQRSTTLFLMSHFFGTNTSGSLTTSQELCVPNFVTTYYLNL